MDYEKKHQEDLEAAKGWLAIAKENNNKIAIQILENLFPELKENEDEKIRKALIKVFSNREKYLIDQSFGDITVSEALVWLEKQSKKDIQVIFPTFTFDDILALQCCMKTVEKVQKDEELYNQLKSLHDRLHDAYWLEKQGEQEPIDKVESKFKVGDWITNGEYIWRVTGIGQLDYILQSQNGDTVDDTISYVDEYFHFWTIQDAKDGDVLVDSYAIIIFRKIGNYVWDDVVDFYICYNFEKGIILQSDNLHCGSIDRVFFKPATKEKRDFLFQKMKEARYEWDAEKKELKKIEQNLAWNGADEAGFGNALWAIEQARSIAKDENDMGNLWYAERWLQSVKERMKGE